MGAPRHKEFRRRPGTELLLDPVHAPDQVRRLPGQHRIVVQLLLEIASGMRPTILLSHRRPPHFGVSRIGAVAITDQRALEVAEETLHMVAGAGWREVEHHFVPVAENRPVAALFHLARLAGVAPGPHRRLVHDDDGAFQNRAALRLEHRPGSGTARLAQPLKDLRLTAVPLPASIWCWR